MRRAATRRRNWVGRMLVVDSSALIALLLEEPEGAACAKAIADATVRVISAANYVEAGTVLAGRAKPGEEHQAIVDLDAFLAAFQIGIAPLDEQQARIALKARIAFGNGFGTRGGLNFGDCFAYALAKSRSAALLYVGDDFVCTDVEPALAR